jgi:hypothetical protein
MGRQRELWKFHEEWMKKGGKIRDKGTISDCIDREFTVISLKNQSRAKINMLLEIVLMS